jgi:hypothetical protein
MHSPKQSDFEMNFEEKRSIAKSDFEGKRSMLESAFEGKRSMLEQWFRALSGLKACSSNDFECSVASKEKEACSSSDFERSVACRRYKKQARAVISSAQWLRSTFEQWFRALSRRSCACAVFSSAVKLVSRLTFSRPTGDLSGEPIFLYIKYFVLFSSRWCAIISLMCERLLVKRHLSKAPMDSKDHAGLELELELEVALAIALNLSRIRAALRSAYCQMEAWSHLTNQLGVSQPIKRASYSASQSCTQSGRPASSAAAAMAAAWVSADGHLLQMAAMAAAWILNASVVSASMRVSKRINHRTTQSSWEREIFGNCPWGAQTSANHWAIGCRSGSSYSA